MYLSFQAIFGGYSLLKEPPLRLIDNLKFLFQILVDEVCFDVVQIDK